jgi:hypothetical protein
MDTSQATVPGQHLQNLPELMEYGFVMSVCVYLCLLLLNECVQIRYGF